MPFFIFFRDEAPEVTERNEGKLWNVAATLYKVNLSIIYKKNNKYIHTYMHT